MRRPKKYRRRRIPWFVILLGIFVAVIVGGIAFYVNQQGSYHFPFSCLPTEPATFHIHPYLRIVINGQDITIPAAIGINNPGGANSCFEPVHTHDTSGIIHVESLTSVNYTLSDFFTIWNDTNHLNHSIMINGLSRPIIFNETDILGFRADSNHRIVLLVDGQPSSEYQSLGLNTHDYCDTTRQNVPPCSPTAGGEPAYGGIAYPYGTGHTIVIEYLSTA